MIIAQEKKKDNIAEYILYMWQIEDMIRACEFDMQIIEEKLIAGYQTDETLREEIRHWYSQLIADMKKEGIEKAGHLTFLKDNVYKLYKLHTQLLGDDAEIKYDEIFKWAKPNIRIFREKSRDQASNDVEIALNALYSLLILRLQKKDISNETEEAMRTFSNFMGYLSQKYKSLYPSS